MGTADPPPAVLPGALHPLREQLINELHARPFEPLAPPVRASHLAVVTGESVETARDQHRHFVRLCARYDVAPPAPDAKHFVQDLGPFRVRWERHTEFSTYTFFRSERFAAPFADPVLNLVPGDWLRALPGKVHTYATMALLALPPAQDAIPRIARSEAALSEITHALGIVRNLAGERALLAEITALAGEVERLQASSGYRFSASRAYHQLVLARLSCLIGDAARALKVFIHAIEPELVMGIAIPIVVAVVWRGIRHVRRIASRDEKQD